MSDNDPAPEWFLHHISGNPQEDISNGYDRGVIDAQQGQYLHNTQFSNETYNVIAQREFQHQVYDDQLLHDDQPPISFLETLSGGTNQYDNNCYKIKKGFGLNGKKYNYVRHYAENYGIPRTEQEARQNYMREMNKVKQNGGGSKHNLSRESFADMMQNNDPKNTRNTTNNRSSIDYSNNRRVSYRGNNHRRHSPYQGNNHRHNHQYTGVYNNNNSLCYIPNNGNDDAYLQQKQMQNVRKEQETRRQRQQQEEMKRKHQLRMQRLQREYKEKEQSIMREHEHQKQQHQHQIQDIRHRTQNEIKEGIDAYKMANDECAKKNKLKQKMDQNASLYQLESIYWKLIDVYIPNMKRLKQTIHSKYNNEYVMNYDQLKRENDRLNEYHIDVLNEPNIQQFVLIGKTGDGKSTFGNRLWGDQSQYGDRGPFGTIHGTVNSVTSSIKRSNTVTLQNNKISIIDTPGIFDTNGHDNFHLNEIIAHLRGSNGINAFVMCCKTGRLDLKYREMLKDLQSMLTPRFWSNVVMVFTFCQDQDVRDWNTLKLEYWQTITRELNLKNNVFELYQIIGVNNNDRRSYSLCIDKLLHVVNDPNKFNQQRFKNKQLTSPIDTLKGNTVCIQNEMKTQISKIKAEQDKISNCKQKLSETINECSAFHIDSKYIDCINTTEQLLIGLDNDINGYILHDVSHMNCYINTNTVHSNNDHEMKYQQELSQIQQQLESFNYEASPYLFATEVKHDNIDNDITSQYSMPCPLTIKRVFGEGIYYPRERRQYGWCLQNKSNATLELQCRLECISNDDTHTEIKVQMKQFYDVCVPPNKMYPIQIEVEAPAMVGEYYAIYNLVSSDGTIMADSLMIECDVQQQ
eukprot:723494_1